MSSSDALELNYELVENQRRIAREKAEAAAQAEVEKAIAADQRNNIITRTASRTIITRAPPQLSRSDKTIGELLVRGHSPSDIALHLGIPLSLVFERQEQLRSPSYDRLLRKFMSTGELEYPDQYVSVSIFQK